jgi:hypothetical protein
VVEKQENKLEFTLQAEKTIRFNQKRKHRPWDRFKKFGEGN